MFFNQFMESSELSRLPEDAPLWVSHLSELRNRGLWCALAWIIANAVCFLASESTLKFLLTLAPKGVILVQLAPAEVLLSSVKLSLWLGTALSAPVILYHVARFASPGLTQAERFWMRTALWGGSFLFAFGVGFAFWAVLPPTLSWLLGFGANLAVVQLSVARFVDFCLGLTVLMGLVFELPLVIFILGLAKLVNTAMLLSRWRGCVIGVVILGAILSPSQDPVSMALVSLALTVLLSISLVGLWMLESSRKLKASQ
ncbi:MAG: twin-arginine translocase subunit TatC [Vampirovibrionales bacterium]|nr:twin-arginine translocase subunit TatC [Vampirovibrionales bacterium]